MLKSSCLCRASLRLKHFIIQQIHKYIIRGHIYNYYKIFKIFKNAFLNIYKYFIIILIVSSNYILVHVLDNKVF